MKDNKYDFINLTLDTECAMKNDHDKIIFDIAWTVCNINKPNFEFLHKKRFIVKESYENINHWIFRRRKDKKQYDFDESRYQRLHSDVIAGNLEVLEWREIYRRLMTDLWSLGVEGFTAYYLKHDWGCLKKTHLRFCHEDFALPTHIKPWCSMDFVGTELLGHKYFAWVDAKPKDVIERYNLLTDGGNYGYSAEIAGKYLNDDVGYAEPHTALYDATMETVLNTHTYRLHKNRFEKYLNNIQCVHWTYFKSRLSSAKKRVKRDSRLIKPLVPIKTKEEQVNLVF